MFNTPTPGKRTYYLCQRKVLSEVFIYVKSDCHKNASKIECNSCLITDGRWNHIRNGSSSTVSFIDQKQIKVVNYENTNTIKGIFSGKYIGLSRNMETAGVIKGLENLSHYIKDTNTRIAQRNTIKKRFEIFSMLKIQIIEWFKYLIYNVEAPEKPLKYWLNTTKHATGNNDECVQ